MTPGEIVLVGAVFFCAAFTKGVTGLGFASIALPLLALALGLKTAMPLVIVPSLTSNLLVMRDAGGFGAMARRFWPLYLSALPGVLIGLWCLTWVSSIGAGAVLGSVLFVYGAFMVSRPPLALAPDLERPLAPIIGLTTGTLNGLTGSQVMPILPYLMALPLTPNQLIQTINTSFTLSSLLFAAGLATIGLMTPQLALLSVAGLVPVFLGIKAGGLIRARLQPEAFRRLILVFLMAMGLALILKAFV
ncbi:MAG: sulfite exporter TauE/SafE family protein [Pseudomonadota bacterium]